MKNIKKILIILLIIWPAYAQSRPIQQTIEVKPENHTEKSPTTKSDTEIENKNSAVSITSLNTPFITENCNQHSAEDADQSEEKGTEFWSPFFGFKLKITDTFIAIFTGLLFFATVALYLATHRLVINSDRMTRRTERAYLIGGGPEVQKDGSSIMTIDNVGRTAGFITKVQWKICNERDFIFDEEVSKCLILIKGVTGDVIDEDNVWPASMKLGLEHFKITNHSDHIGRIFFGRIDFKDIFGDSHYSTFKLQLHPGGSRTIRGSYSEGWE